MRFNKGMQLHSILNTAEHRQIYSQEMVDRSTSLSKLRRFIFHVKRLHLANITQSILETINQGRYYVFYKAHCYFACFPKALVTLITSSEKHDSRIFFRNT